MTTGLCQNNKTKKKTLHRRKNGKIHSPEPAASILNNTVATYSPPQRCDRHKDQRRPLCVKIGVYGKAVPFAISAPLHVFLLFFQQKVFHFFVIAGVIFPVIEAEPLLLSSALMVFSFSNFSNLTLSYPLRLLRPIAGRVMIFPEPCACCFTSSFGRRSSLEAGGIIRARALNFPVISSEFKQRSEVRNRCINSRATRAPGFPRGVGS